MSDKEYNIVCCIMFCQSQLLSFFYLYCIKSSRQLSLSLKVIPVSVCDGFSMFLVANTRFSEPVFAEQHLKNIDTNKWPVFLFSSYQNTS